MAFRVAQRSPAPYVSQYRDFNTDKLSHSHRDQSVYFLPSSVWIVSSSITASISRRGLIMMARVTGGFSQLMRVPRLKKPPKMLPVVKLDNEDKQHSHKILFRIANNLPQAASVYITFP